MHALLKLVVLGGATALLIAGCTTVPQAPLADGPAIGSLPAAAGMSGQARGHYDAALDYLARNEFGRAQIEVEQGLALAPKNAELERLSADISKTEQDYRADVLRLEQDARLSAEKAAREEAEARSAAEKAAREQAEAARIAAGNEQSAVNRMLPSVVKVIAGNSEGTGIVVGSDGLILTNAHVVAGGRRVEVRLRDGRSLAASIDRSDADADLALLRVAQRGLQAATLGNSEALALGEPVIAIGYALGLRGEPSITRGVFSGHRTGPRVDYVQTDAAINHGNSGGPMISLKGEVIAVSTAGIRDGDVQGVNFGIAAKSVREFLSGSTVGAGGEARPPAPAPPEPPVVRVIKKYGAAIRSSASSQAPVLYMAACNELLPVRGRTAGWLQVATRGGQVGWVGELRVAEEANPAPVDCTGAVNYPIGGVATATVPSGCLSLRRQPSRTAPFDECVPNGQRLTILNGPIEVAGEDWFEVQGTAGGWTRGEFLRPS